MGHGYTEGKGGQCYTEGKMGHSYTGEWRDMAVLSVRGDMSILWD